MDAAGEQSVRRNSPYDLKSMLKTLFEAEYYSSMLELQKSVGLHIRLETAQTQLSGSSKNVDLENTIMEDISNSNGPLSALVLGDSGTGKSWLALKLAKKLYDSTQPAFQNKVPVYIPLGRIEKMISQQKIQESSRFRSDILFSYIMNHKNHFPFEDWKLQNLYLDLCASELILILDGYDELKVKSNLWEENKWNTKDFKNVRTVVTCRPNALVDVDISKLFGFLGKQQCSYAILPLEGIVVEKYISQVSLFLHSIEYDSKVNDPWMMTKCTTKDHPKWESAQEDSEYKYWFLDRLPELQGLAQNVFILTTICQLLPRLVETERIASKGEHATAQFMLKLQEICRTEVLLYDKFTEAWFSYQVDRMEPTGHTHFLYQNRNLLHHYMGGYAQNLAMRCAQLNRGMVSNGEISENNTWFWNLWTPWSLKTGKFHRDNSIEAQLFPQDETDANENRLQNLKFLRDSCLLRYDSGAKVFGFLHLSLFEYFLSREVFEKYRGALNYYSNWNRRRDRVYFPINQKNINDPEFTGVLSMLVGRAKTDEEFQDILLRTIKKSATLAGIEQMASNAFTILNLSGYSFSGKNNEDDNFQNIQVPGANFRNSICGNSDFSGANFEDAKLNQGWFQRCKFQGANFSNSSFGQTPPIGLGLKKSLIHDILCCTIDGFEHIFLCFQEQSPTAGVVDVYVANYKLNTDFEFLELNSIFVQQLSEKVEYLFSLVKLSCSVVLFCFVPRDLFFLKEQIMFPESWYEFSSTSLVNSGKFDETDLELDLHLNYFKNLEYIQKFILFSRNKNPEFCDKKRLQLVYGKNRRDRVPFGACWLKYIWIPFGPFKFLVSVFFRDVDEIENVFLLENFQYVSVLHNWKPILCNNESVPLEIFWQANHSDDNIIQEGIIFDKISLHCRGSYFDENAILSFPCTENIYFLDLKNNKVLTILKNNIRTESITHKQSAKSLELAFARLFDYSRKETPKVVNIATRRNAGCCVHENLDFIALKNIHSTEVFNVANGTLSQNVLKDFQTPITFKRGNGCTYLVYVSKHSLHFEKLDMIDVISPKKKTRAKTGVEKYFSEDGSLGISFPFTVRALIFDVWKFHYDTDGNVWKEIFDWRIYYKNVQKQQFKTQKHGVLITPNNFVVFYFCLSDPPALLGVPQMHWYDSKCRKVFELNGIPHDKMTSETEILMFQDYQKIVFRKDNEFACYSVTEFCYCGDIFVELTHNVNFNCNLKCPEFALDPNQHISYIFSKNVTDIDCIGVWNLRRNTYINLTVKKKKKFPHNKVSLCTVLLKTKISQGYCREDYLYIVRSIEYSNLHPESPVKVSSRPELRWIVAQFLNGDLVILESVSLEPLFVFCGFQPGYKFQITLTSPQQVRIALVKNYSGEVVWLSINAATLKKCYEQGELTEFKDWKVDKSELPSSTLSLREVDISSSRSVKRRQWSLFKFHGSLGSPSEGDGYQPFCNLFIPVTDYQHSILVTSHNEQPVDLTKKWKVTVIAKKNKFKLMRTTVYTSIERHTALIIEGVLHGGHFVIRAELIRDHDTKVKINCAPYRGKSKYEEIAKKYFGKQIEVSPEMGMKLLKNIWVDTYNPQWEYNLLFHNCNSWCKEKLQVCNLESKFKSKLYNCFANLPKDFELEEFKLCKRKKNNA